MSRRNNTARKIVETTVVESKGVDLTKHPLPTEEQVEEALIDQGDTVAIVVEEPAAVVVEQRTMETVEELIAMGHTTKSDQIRYLYSMGHKAGPISKQLNIIYQHAYNVIKKPLKRVVSAA